MTISRLLLSIAATLAIGGILEPSAAAAAGGGIVGAILPGNAGGGAVPGSGSLGGGGAASGGGGGFGGFAGGAPGAAFANRIGPAPFAASRSNTTATGAPTTGANSAGASSGTHSGAATAGNVGYYDPQSAFLASAVATPFAERRDSGSLDLVSSFQDKDGRACREYRETVTMDGKPVEATGKVCQSADGRWALAD
ncbi:MAG: 17 kDa outer rane surface antigen [Rhodospirillales bacterium]|nr:17 kDa outer rane surface antigen [Rhodospirillales bacterium]